MLSDKCAILLPFVVFTMRNENVVINIKIYFYSHLFKFASA